MDPKILRKLAEDYLYRTMLGAEPRCTPEDLIDDGRKRQSAIKELKAAGYVCTGNTSYVIITSKAYDERPAHEPSDFDLRKIEFDPNRPGHPFHLLSLEQQKYVWENRKLYDFHVYDTARHTATKVSPEEIPAGAIWRISGSKELVISNEAYRHERETALFVRRVQGLKRTRLAWGLVKAGVLTKEMADCIQIEESGTELELVFSQEPTRWEAEVGPLVDRLNARIRGDQRLMNALLTIQVGMDAYGGWAKFLDDYEKGLVEEIRTRGEVKAKPASSLDVDWKPVAAEEVFGFMHLHFDVNHAKEILKREPHPIDALVLAQAKGWIGEPPAASDGRTGTRIGLIRVDWERVLAGEVDLEIPVIAVRIRVGAGEPTTLPIDGWNRIAKGIQKGLETLPLVVLTEAETDTIRV